MAHSNLLISTKLIQAFQEGFFVYCKRYLTEKQKDVFSEEM